MRVATRHPRSNEKRSRQLSHRLGTPLIREVLADFRQQKVSALEAAQTLGLSRSRLYQLYVDCHKTERQHQY